MARLDGLGGFKTFNIDCESSRYNKLADAAGFDMGPRLGRMVASPDHPAQEAPGEEEEGGEETVVSQ